MDNELNVYLSKKATKALADLCLEQEEGTTYSTWIRAKALKPVIRSTADGRNALKLRGQLTLPNGEVLKEDDLPLQQWEVNCLPPFEIRGKDPAQFAECVQVTVSDRMQQWILETVAFVNAVNCLTKTPNAKPLSVGQWVWEVTTNAIAAASSKADSEDLDSDSPDPAPKKKDGKK